LRLQRTALTRMTLQLGVIRRGMILAHAVQATNSNIATGALLEAGPVTQIELKRGQMVAPVFFCGKGHVTIA
jgi:hypothetical protein